MSLPTIGHILVYLLTVEQILGVGYSVIALISMYSRSRVTLSTNRLLVGSYGGGIHIWNVPIEDRVPFQKA